MIYGRNFGAPEIPKHDTLTQEKAPREVGHLSVDLYLGPTHEHHASRPNDDSNNLLRYNRIVRFILECFDASGTEAHP